MRENDSDCVDRVQLTGKNLLLSCEATTTAVLYQLNELAAYVMNEVYRISDVANNDAQLHIYDSQTSLIYYSKSYQKSNEQSNLLQFIDTVYILQS